MDSRCARHSAGTGGDPADATAAADRGRGGSVVFALFALLTVNAVYLVSITVAGVEYLRHVLEDDCLDESRWQIDRACRERSQQQRR